MVREIALRPGDAIRVTGRPDGAERAALDYVEIHAAETDTNGGDA